MGEARRQLDTLVGGHRIHDIATPDILEAASRLMKIDLLITVDTMAAHLAAALGVRVWTMLPWEADWRWMLDREDTPWYPTMRLFRQPSPGDWHGVVERIAAELPGCFD
jgi:ADP-heptose:LPS heptosyltransferase